MANTILDRLKRKHISDIYAFLLDITKAQQNKILYIKTLNKERKNLNGSHLFPLKIKLQIEEELNSKDLYISNSYLNHCFDLLGSGWKQNNCLFESDLKDWMKNNVPEFYIETSVRICNLVLKNNREYNFINWQRDYKNNYSFNGKEKSSKIKLKGNCFYDIKIPWELARCQHLPYLSRLYLLTHDDKFIKEIRNEILDFIAFNPVGFGVNWKSGMDVGIRISNWVMAVMLGVPDDSTCIFDAEFRREFKKSVVEHCVFLRYHLENTRNFRGNHYFANIVGLLYSSAFMCKSKWRDSTLEFAVVELIKSVNEQFYPDGGNFEASIPYHKLTLEMAIYGILFIFFLKEHSEDGALITRVLLKYNEEYNESICILNKALIFMEDSIKPNGEIYQLGDNDSGHFFRFFHFGDFHDRTTYENLYENIETCGDDVCWDENELYAGEIKILSDVIQGENVKNTFMKKLIKYMLNEKKVFKRIAKNSMNIFPEKDINNSLKFVKTTVFEFKNPIDLKSLRLIFYPDFGFYGCRGEKFFLGVSSGNNGQNGKGGHSHNDKLSFELQVNGEDFVLDPGSYVYTESINNRNLFRSTTAHFIPYFGEEQNRIDENCFCLQQETYCRVLKLTPIEMIFECQYRKHHHIRIFTLKENALILEDRTKELIVRMEPFRYYSKGYGKLKRR